MTWYAPQKAAAPDPDNPTADQQFPFSEFNNMVTYLKDRISNHVVNAAAIGNDKILVYKAAGDGTFVYEDQNGITALNDIPDVVISGVPADNEVVAYDTATSKFINQTAAEAGLALVANVVLEADFAATTFLYATADNTPQPKTVAETLAILSVESGADVTDVTNVTAAGAVMASEFDATTFLYATADNTPLPKTRAETMAILSGTAAAEFLFNTQKVGGIVDPTTAQQAATKNYADTHLFTKEAVTDFTNDYIPVYKTASGKFEMEEQSAAIGLPVVDTTAIIKGSADGTKLVRFEVDGLTTGTTRVMTIPDKNMTLADKAEVMLLDGSQAMAANMDMGGYNLSRVGYIQADAASGVIIASLSGTNLMQLGIGDESYILEPMVMFAKLNMLGQDLDDIGSLILNNATELTISSGIVTITQSYHTIDTEGDIASDDLHTLNGGVSGQTIVLRATNDARTVVVKDSLGVFKLRLAGDMTLDNTHDSITLLCIGSDEWIELSRSDNGA